MCDNGLIVMIEAKTTTKKNLLATYYLPTYYLLPTTYLKWLYFGLARHTFVTSDGYKIIEMVRTLS